MGTSGRWIPAPARSCLSDNRGILLYPYAASQSNILSPIFRIHSQSNALRWTVFQTLRVQPPTFPYVRRYKI